ncbi:CGNR zinc finger domain-containing protein [Streptosporangium sp. NPDC048865]|uniref:CGNR zinc finger domain-containing protein n=1 Tax=Streptosporangium sp. NPDC048865 TaxID=3155766 RepID=UPI0034260470
MSDDTSGSTGRFGLPQAPGGLCLLQDLLNTAGMAVAPVPDLLDDETTARSWIDASLRTWGEQTGQTPPRIAVSSRDLPALRALRGHVRDWLTGEAEDRTPHPLTAGISFRHGRLAYEPQGNGAVAVASLVHLEALLASHTGTFTRLKTCMNPACGVAFYDMSRNSTRVWHDMKTCGNVMNLRASRARRRGTAAP